MILKNRILLKQAFCLLAICACLLTSFLPVCAEDDADHSVTTYSGSISRTVYNPNGQTVSDYLGVYRADILRVLGAHINDNYFLGTPYKSGDHRNPNGDPAGYGSKDTAGVPAMNCTGFVCYVLAAAGSKTVPGQSGWDTMLINNKIQYITYVGSTADSQALKEAVAADAEPGDIIWAWEGPKSFLANGISTVLSSNHHVGFYVGEYFNSELLPSNPTGKWNCTSHLAWWHSTNASHGTALPDPSNLVTEIAPKASYCISYTLIKLSGSLEGNLTLQKGASFPDISQSNSAYDLSGAVYGVYSDEACTKKVGELITDTSGKTNTLTLKEGNYWVKELSPPKGYLLDTQIYPAKVRFSKTTTLSVQDTEQYYPVDILLYKKETDTQTPVPHAEFTVKFYEGQFDSDTALQGIKPLRTWILQTDKHGICRLEDSWKLSGDPFYLVNGCSVLPLGTLTIQETKAPDGYLLSNSVSVYPLISNPSGESLKAFQAPVFENAAAKGIITLQKTDLESGEALAGAAFDIIAAEDIVSSDGTILFSKQNIVETMITDENGKASSRELPLGSYIVKENLPPQGYLLSEEEYLVELNYIDSQTPLVRVALEISNQPLAKLLQTIAKIKEDGSKEAVAQNQVTIVDSVYFEHLQIGQEYRIQGILMNQATEKPLSIHGKSITSEKTFVAETSNGMIEMEFTFDASELADCNVVVFEKVFIGETEILSHEDIHDQGQTIHFLPLPDDEPVPEKPLPETPAPEEPVLEEPAIAKTGDSNADYLLWLLPLIFAGILIPILFYKRQK